MGVRVQTKVQLSCDGPPHNYIELTLAGTASVDRVKDVVFASGWVLTEDEKIYCPLHIAWRMDGR